MKKCITCQDELTGLQRKFCSQRCKHADTNNRHQNYIAQSKRGKERRLKLLKLKGGKCKNCNYAKNQASLVFHHINPKTKKFNVDIRKCSNSKWDNLLEEVNKCEVLCHNCHNELHHPDMMMVGLPGFEPRT